MVVLGIRRNMRALIGFFTLFLAVNVQAMQLSKFQLACTSSAIESDSVASLKTTALTHLRTFKLGDKISDQDQLLKESFLKEYERLNESEYLGSQEVVLRFNLYLEKASEAIVEKLNDMGYLEILDRLIEKSEVIPEYSNEKALQGFRLEPHIESNREIPIEEVVFPKQVIVFREVHTEFIWLFKRLNEDLRQLQIRKLALEEVFDSKGLIDFVRSGDPSSVKEESLDNYQGLMREYFFIETSLQHMLENIEQMYPYYINLEHISNESKIKYLN